MAFAAGFRRCFDLGMVWRPQLWRPGRLSRLAASRLPPVHSTSSPIDEIESLAIILGFQLGMTGTETQPYALLSPGRPGDLAGNAPWH